MEDQFSVLRQMYADFNAKAIDRVLARLHEDVVWPNGWEGGTVTGRDAVRHYWTRQWAAINPVVEPQEFVLLSDRRILVRVHQRVQSLAGDLLSDELISHIYTVDQGLIRGMEISSR